MKHRPIIKFIFLPITAALALPCSTMAAAVDSKPGQPAGDNSVLSMVFDCPARDLDVRSMRCATTPFDYVSLSKIPFRHDETTLDARAKTILDAAIIYLHLHVDSVRRVLINGHADDVGDFAYNDKLSRKRAEAVRDYLVARGVEADLVRLRYAGEIQPVDESWNDYGRRHNRRVALYVVKNHSHPRTAEQ